MKAILVVDMPEVFKYAVDEIRVDVRGNVYGELIIDYRNQALKPMPDKLDWKVGYAKDKNTCVIFNKNYVDGYNKCIDEILGE